MTGPDRALMIAAVPLLGFSSISARITGIAGGEGSQAEGVRRSRATTSRMLFSSHPEEIGNDCREDLVGADGGVLMVYHIEEAAVLAVPESEVAFLDLISELGNLRVQGDAQGPGMAFCLLRRSTRGRLSRSICPSGG